MSNKTPDKIIGMNALETMSDMSRIINNLSIKKEKLAKENKRLREEIIGLRDRIHQLEHLRKEDWDA